MEKVNKRDPEWMKKSDWAVAAWSCFELNMAIDLLQKTNFKVTLCTNKETGKKRTAIIPGFIKSGDEEHFWVDSFKTIKKAEAMCELMGWEIVGRLNTIQK